MQRDVRLPSLATLLALVLVAAFAAQADARTKRFKPLDFVVQHSSLDAIRSPIAVGGSSGNAWFAAPLGLPAGATITGFRFYTNGIAASRGATIEKFQNDGLSEAVAKVSTSASVPSLVTPAATNGTLNPDPSDLVIDANYLYYVDIYCSASTAIWAVEVDYTP